MRTNAAWLVLVALAGCKSTATRPIEPIAPPSFGHAVIEVGPVTRDYRGEVDIDGVMDFVVSPGGTLWLAPGNDVLYRADRVNGDWQAVTPGGMLGHHARVKRHDLIFHVSFFNEQIAIAAGKIGDTFRDQLYRTGDGGETWQLVSIGAEMFFRNVFTNAQGEAWLIGLSGDVLYSSDFGHTFSPRPSPLDPDGREIPYFMVTFASSSGVMGDRDNALKLTRDGGATWTDIPTPLDQGAIGPRSKITYGDKQITRVALFNEHLVIIQGKRAFRTPLDAIHWEPFPESVIDVTVTPVGEQLIGLSAQGDVVSFDRRFTSKIEAREALPVEYAAFTASRRNVYIADHFGGLYDVAFNMPPGYQSAVFSYPLTSRHETRIVKQARRHGDHLWSATNHHLYSSDDGGARWHRLGSFHFYISCIAVRNEREVLVLGSYENNVVFNRDTRTTTPIPELADQYIAGMWTGSELWVAYGGASVFVSYDRGYAWTQIEHWDGESIREVFVSPGRRIYLRSDSRSIRTLTERDGRWRSDDVLVASAQSRHAIPPLDELEAFYFADDKVGYMIGRAYAMRLSYQTDDGGKTWRRSPLEQFDATQIVPMEAGYLAPNRDALYLLRGQERTLLYQLPDAQLDQVIRSVSVDHSDRILIEVADYPARSYETLSLQTWTVLPAPATRSPDSP